MRTLQIILVSIFLSVLPQIKAIQTQTVQEQVIENRIEQRQNAKDIEELNSSIKEIDNKIEKKVDDRIDVMKGNLEGRDHAVDWWLGLIGIVLTVLGFILPLFAWELRGDLKNKQKIADESIKKLISNNETAIKDLIETTNVDIDEIKRISKLNLSNLEMDAKSKLQEIKYQADKYLKEIEEKRNKTLNEGKEIDISVEGKTYEPDEEIVNSDLNKVIDYQSIYELYDSKNYKATITECQRFLELENLSELDKIYLFKILIDCYKEENDFLKQKYYFDYLIELEPNSTNWLKLGNVLMKLNLNLEAENAIRKSLELNPDSYQAMFNLGKLLINNKRIEESIEWLVKASELAPFERRIKLQLAHAYYALKNYNLAIKSYEEILKNEPEIHDVKFFNNLSMLYILFGLPREALKYAEKCIDINPKDAFAFYHKSRALNELDNFNEAFENYIIAYNLCIQNKLVELEKSCCVNIIELASLIDRKSIASEFFEKFSNKFSSENDYQFYIVKTMYKIIFDEDYSDSKNLAFILLENQIRNGEFHENHWSFELVKKALNNPITEFISKSKKLVLLEFTTKMEELNK